MKQKAKIVSPWKLGVLCVLCVTLVIVFACSEDPGKDAHGNSVESARMEGGVFTVVEAQPEFKGGPDAFYKYIMNEIRYPDEARRLGVEGRVDVQFVIGKDGSLSEVKAVKGIGAGCDEEAVRVLQNAPAFKPGIQNGKPVFVRMVVPIVFKLDEERRKNPDNSAKGMVIIEQLQQKNERLKVDYKYAAGEWSGKVYDGNGEGLPGANIVAIGTSIGTTSGVDGTFNLRASQDNALAVSFIGYESVKLSAP